MSEKDIPDYSEWADLIWSEYEYRHGLYWKSLYLWGGAAVTVYIAPFLRQEVQELGSAVYIFPVLGLAISLIGAWHLAAESERISVVMGKYNELRKGHKPGWPYVGKERTWYQQAITESIGQAVTLIFTVGLGAFAAVDVLFLLILQDAMKWHWPFIAAIAIVISVAIFFFVKVQRRKVKYNNSL